MILQGVDDIHALLLALAASPDELELELISVTWGNVEAKRLAADIDDFGNLLMDLVVFGTSFPYST